MSKETQEQLKPKSVFINQVDGGYVINLQGNNHYPVKIAVSTGDMVNAVSNFFDTVEKVNSNEQNQGQIGGNSTTGSQSPSAILQGSVS
jgi:hypothetical protein